MHRTASTVAALAASAVLTLTGATSAQSAPADTATARPTAAAASTSAPSTHTRPDRARLVRPQHVAVDEGLSQQRADLFLRRVRQLYTFWDTGDARFLRRADSPSFVDHTLPAGRPQGLEGILQASRTFRAAVPDLHCTVADVLITGDRASVRQVYTGHFTGTFHGIQGQGQTVRFNAFDIQQLGKRTIVGDWHLEDDLTFMKQIGAVR